MGKALNYTGMRLAEGKAKGADILFSSKLTRDHAKVPLLRNGRRCLDIEHKVALSRASDARLSFFRFPIGKDADVMETENGRCSLGIVFPSGFWRRQEILSE